MRPGPGPGPLEGPQWALGGTPTAQPAAFQVTGRVNRGQDGDSGEMHTEHGLGSGLDLGSSPSSVRASLGKPPGCGFTVPHL